MVFTAELSVPQPRLQIAFLLACCAVVGPTGRFASAVTPESPEVKAVVEKALKYLDDKVEPRLGGKCLIGLCFLKNNRPATHPKVVEAVNACKAGFKDADNYSLGIATMFLVEADPDGNKPLIEQMIAEILSRQQKGGGWSYTGYSTGDTSQTQYAVLAIWIAQSNGIPVPVEVQERVLNWLLRVQDPTGGFGYQGNDPGNATRVQQSDVQASLTAAGLGSVYILADMLSLVDPPPEQNTNVPGALKQVKAKAAKRQPKTNKVDMNILRRTVAEGDRWMANPDVSHLEWLHYYLYALERYRSFREHAEGKSEKEPKWYNDTFQLLKNSQQGDGSWKGKDNDYVATCFSILFLSRSSKKAIAKVVALGDGTLLGGMGLPPNAADLKEKNGKVMETPLSGGIDELLALLEDEDNPELARMAEGTAVIELDKNVSKRGGQITKLRDMVSAKSFESRLVAVRSLGKVRDFDNVPILLYALTDPDLRVISEADKALRFISRKLEGTGLQLSSGQKPSPAQLDKLRADWRKWYLSIRPDAEFLD